MLTGGKKNPRTITSSKMVANNNHLDNCRSTIHCAVSWFGTVSGPFQHAAQARLRAIEQGLPLVRVANTGLTEVVDARGRITASLPFGTNGFLDAALPGPLPAPPYARWGEIPALFLLAGCCLYAFRRPKSALA